MPDLVRVKLTDSEKGPVETQVPLSAAADLIVQTCILPVFRKKDAYIVVSGGRGVKSREGFRQVIALAGLLQADIGTSRAALVSGFSERAFLVGCNGRTVVPDLYIACGISGSPQHFYGMQTSHIVLALTDDPTTPMYREAHFALISDLKVSLPVMDAAIRKALGLPPKED